MNDNRTIFWHVTVECRNSSSLKAFVDVSFFVSFVLLTSLVNFTTHISPCGEEGCC